MRTALAAVLTLAMTVAAGAQGEGRPGLLDAVGEESARVPSLEDLFLDLSVLLDRTDPSKAETLRSRLGWTDRRLEGLEHLHTQVRAGLAIEIPEDFLSPPIAGASEAMLERTRREVQGLRARHDLARTGLGEESSSGKRNAPESTNLSTFGMAVLYLNQDVPLPPDSAAGSFEAVQKAANKADLGKSLQRLGDHQGAMNAFLGMPEIERTPGVWYRMAQCSEKLHRWTEAEGYYKKVVEADADRVWGRMAKQRLEFGLKVHGRRSTGKDKR